MLENQTHFGVLWQVTSEDAVQLAAGWALEIGEFVEGDFGGFGSQGWRVSYMELGADFGEGIYRHVSQFAPDQEVSGLGDVNCCRVGLAAHGDGHRDLEEVRNWR